MKSMQQVYGRCVLTWSNSYSGGSGQSARITFHDKGIYFMGIRINSEQSIDIRADASSSSSSRPYLSISKFGGSDIDTVSLVSNEGVHALRIFKIMVKAQEGTAPYNTNTQMNIAVYPGTGSSSSSGYEANIAFCELWVFGPCESVPTITQQ